MIPGGGKSGTGSVRPVRGSVWMSAGHQLIVSLDTDLTPAAISEQQIRLILRQAVVDRFPGQSVEELVMATATEALEYFEDDEMGHQFGVVLKTVGAPA